MPPCEGGYKYFKIGNLFDIKKGRRLTKAQMVEGSTNFIGATATNNGITAKIGNKGHIHPAGTITVTYNGSVGEAFYQIQPFWASDDVNVLYPKFEMTEHSAIYFLTPLRKKGKSYGYSYKWTKEMMENDSILLPITNSGEIDFQFIESRIRELEEERMRELEEERMRELEAYLTAAGFADCSLTPTEEEALRKFSNGEVKLCAHNIIDTFHVANTHNILKSDVVFGSGTTPYVTASASNNSIVSYISYKQELIEPKNSIMIGGKTLVITYQPNEFFSNDSHNLILRPKNINGRNESCELYAVAALYKSLAPKYSWGDSISKQKIQIDKVFLPTNTNGEIDYDFMETYISAIKKQIIQQLKDFIAKEHSAYQQVINH